MNGDFKGKVVVIAGGTGALGRAAADIFAERGARIIVTGRATPQDGRANPHAEYRILNALDETSVQAFFKEMKGLDVLVNTIGGYAAGDPVEKLELAVFEGQLDLNLKSAFLLTKYAVQAMSERGGKIVHIASRAAVDKGANSFAYSVSKLGILRLVEAVAAETRDRNININAVMPGIIDTPANRISMPNVSHDRWPKADQIAKVIAFLASGEAELISGTAIPVYGKA